MANKKLVHKTDTVKRRVALRSERWKEDYDTEHGYGTRHYTEVESAEFTGRLEIYVDLDSLLAKYAQKAFQSTRKRSKCGPLEIRVVDLRELSGTREVKNPKPVPASA